MVILEIYKCSHLNAANLPQPSLPEGALELSNEEFIAKMETQIDYVTYTFPQDVEGIVFRLKHWAFHAPKDYEDLWAEARFRVEYRKMRLNSLAFYYRKMFMDYYRTDDFIRAASWSCFLL